MGSSKIFNKKQPIQNSSEPAGNQYVKLSDGSLSLYDPKSIQFNYAQQQQQQQNLNKTGVSLGNSNKTGTSLSRLPGSSEQNLDSALLNGQNVELDNGKLKLFSESDYNSWKTNQQAAEQQTAQDLANKKKEAQQSLLDNRKSAANKKNRNKNSMLSPSDTAPTGGSGAYTGIIE